jgi:UDP-N-acetylglucosamine 4-epimerase
VTGGAGFIGSNLVEKLLLSGAKHVRVLDNLSTGNKKNIEPFLNHPNFEWMEGDIRDAEVCVKACEGIDFVSHQAALGSVPRSIKDPLTTNSVNITGFLNMLEAVRNSNVVRMVYASSSSVYGDSKLLPKKEETTGRPLSPYAVTKAVDELYAHVYRLNFGMDITGLRYFNVFGPKQSPKGAYAAVIPLFIQAALSGDAVRIFGDGLQTRDFSYIDNVVEGNILALCNDDLSKKPPVLNIAAGGRVSLNDLVAELSKLSGKQIPVNYEDKRKGDILDSNASIELAKDTLNYEPVCSYEEGLKLTYEWFRSNPDFF